MGLGLLEGDDMGTNLIRALLLTSASVAMVAAVAPTAVYAQEASYQIDIPAQSMGDALRALGKATKQNIVFNGSVVKGKRSAVVRGRMSAAEALDRMLAGSGLRMSRGSRGGLLVREGNLVAASASAETVSVEAVDGVTDDAEILVTGSRIRGAKPTSPVISVTQTDIQNAGQTDLGQVVRSIPQNFSGGQNPGIGFGGEEFGSGDLNGTSSINLRGLGPAATLTLLNGRRLSYGGASQGVDITAIPVAAVESIQIVADGASALYGSDAVAGVANVILRRDFSGLVATGRYGAATDGGYRRYQASLTGGQTWETGGVLIAGDYDQSSKITSGDRSFTSGQNPTATTYPDAKRWGGLVSINQEIGDVAKINVDGLYNSRRSSITTPYTPVGDYMAAGSLTHRRAESFLISPSLQLKLGSWRATLGGSYGQDRTTSEAAAYSGGSVYYANTLKYDNDTTVVELGAEGPAFSLPAGSVRLAFGAGYRSIGLERESRTSGVDSLPNAWSRHNTYGYGELFIPITSPSQALRGLHDFSLSLAMRYEDVQSAGTVATPKIGFIYSPTRDFTLSATWGRSFKAPTLFDQFQGYYALLQPASAFGVVGQPSSATALLLGGGNSTLKPERSTNRVVTLAIHPSAWRDAKLEISYFDIDYKDRIATPISDFGSALANPIYAPFLTLTPSAADLTAAISGAYIFQNATTGAFIPSNVVAIIDDRYRNVARQRVNGLDINASYTNELTSSSSLAATFNASYMRLRRQLNSGEQLTQLTGTLFNPPNWRGRLGLTYTQSDFTLSSFANYIGSLKDVRPSSTISSLDAQTTLDFTAQYRPAWTKRLEFDLAVLNAFNAKPSRIWTSSPLLTPYDSTNYSAIGRTITVSVTTRW